jgi:hypothetical protein
MDKAKRARTAETPKQPSLGLQLRAPHPDRTYSASAPNQPRRRRVRFASDRFHNRAIEAIRADMRQAPDDDQVSRISLELYQFEPVDVYDVLLGCHQAFVE